MALSQIKSSIAIMGGMDYTYRFLKNPNFDNKLGTYNYSTGLNFERQISKNYWLQIGLRYSSLGHQIIIKGLKWGTEHDGMGGYKYDPTLNHSFQTITNYTFLEIPIGIKYIFNKNSIWIPYILAALSTNIYLSTITREITDFTDKTETERSPQIHRISLSTNLGFGIDYSIGKNFSLFAQSLFCYHFTKLVAGPNGEYLYSYGIELGVKKGFN
ncbi:MAG TPA: outer membrane beta-barrel protein [Saprospiraceae bacterium]|nr:outer membrane beta-barrel protein [Saprospiraceae bacterium]